jgi:hypothetical protein
MPGLIQRDVMPGRRGSPHIKPDMIDEAAKNTRIAAGQFSMDSQNSLDDEVMLRPCGARGKFDAA